MGSNCTDFCSCGDDCENHPNEAPETIGVANSSDPDDLNHDDLLLVKPPLANILLKNNAFSRV